MRSARWLADNWPDVVLFSVLGGILIMMAWAVAASF